MTIALTRRTHPRRPPAPDRSIAAPSPSPPLPPRWPNDRDTSPADGAERDRNYFLRDSTTRRDDRPAQGNHTSVIVHHFNVVGT